MILMHVLEDFCVFDLEKWKEKKKGCLCVYAAAFSDAFSLSSAQCNKWPFYNAGN